MTLPNTLPVVVTIRNTVRYTRTVSTVAVVYPTVSPKQHLNMNHKHVSYWYCLHQFVHGALVGYEPPPRCAIIFATHDVTHWSVGSILFMAMSLIRSSASHYTSASMYALNHSSAQCLSLPNHQADHLSLCPPLLLWAYPWSYAWKSV